MKFKNKLEVVNEVRIVLSFHSKGLEKKHEGIFGNAVNSLYFEMGGVITYAKRHQNMHLRLDLFILL